MRYAVAILAIAAGLALAASPAASQPVCPEGRTASGECVNAALAQAQRKQAIALTQQKLSCVSAPVLPIEDRDYPVIRNDPGVLRLFQFGRNIFLQPKAC